VTDSTLESDTTSRAGPAPETLVLGCGHDYQPGAHNVDVNPAVDPDEVVDLEELPWPWPADSFTRIYASHVLEHLTPLTDVLRECARVLAPGGHLKVRWPVGMNERADHDHEHAWVYDTPEMYCGKRPWDPDTGLRVVDRDVSVHTHFEGRTDRFYQWLIQRYEAAYGQGRWLFDLPATSGEFTVLFEARGGEQP